MCRDRISSINICIIFMHVAMAFQVPAKVLYNVRPFSFMVWPRGNRKVIAICSFCSSLITEKDHLKS